MVRSWRQVDSGPRLVPFVSPPLPWPCEGSLAKQHGTPTLSWLTSLSASSSVIPCTMTGVSPEPSLCPSLPWPSSLSSPCIGTPSITCIRAGSSLLKSTLWLSSQRLWLQLRQPSCWSLLRQTYIAANDAGSPTGHCPGRGTLHVCSRLHHTRHIWAGLCSAWWGPQHHGLGCALCCCFRCQPLQKVPASAVSKPLTSPALAVVPSCPILKTGSHTKHGQDDCIQDCETLQRPAFQSHERLWDEASCMRSW